MELRYWLVQREKQQNKLAEWKAFVDTVRIKSADFKNQKKCLRARRPSPSGMTV